MAGYRAEAATCQSRDWQTESMETGHGSGGSKGGNFPTRQAAGIDVHMDRMKSYASKLSSTSATIRCETARDPFFRCNGATHKAYLYRCNLILEMK